MKNNYKKILLVLLLTIQPVQKSHAASSQDLLETTGFISMYLASSYATYKAWQQSNLWALAVGSTCFPLAFGITSWFEKYVPEVCLDKANKTIANSPLCFIFSDDFENIEDRLGYITDRFIYRKYPLVWYAQELDRLKNACISTHRACRKLERDKCYKYFAPTLGPNIDLFSREREINEYEKKIDKYYKEVKTSKGYLEQLKVWQIEDGNWRIKRELKALNCFTMLSLFALISRRC